MDILDTKPNPDGSLVITVELTDEEAEMVLEYGLSKMLREQMERMKNES